LPQVAEVERGERQGQVHQPGHLPVPEQREVDLIRNQFSIAAKFHPDPFFNSFHSHLLSAYTLGLLIYPFDLIKCSNQSDQIGRIFANWAIVYFGQFVEKRRSSP
jgi:hypothetical protein